MSESGAVTRVKNQLRDPLATWSDLYADGSIVAERADRILALFAAHRDAEVEALRGQVMDHDSDLATIADCVNTALRECERGGAQITNLDTTRDQVRALTEENAELHGPLTTKVRAADVVMKAIDDAVTRHYIDARSPIADARLDYGDPFRYTDDALRARAESAEKRLDENTAWLINAEEGYREEHVARLSAERERDEAREKACEKACSAVCGMCRRGIHLEKDERFRGGWRHFDGDAFYTCEARHIRNALTPAKAPSVSIGLSGNIAVTNETMPIASPATHVARRNAVSADTTKPSAEMVTKAREYPPCTLYTGWECNGDRVCSKHYDMALALDAIASERDDTISDLRSDVESLRTTVAEEVTVLQKLLATERAARSQLESSYVVLADAELFVRLERDDLLRDLRIEHEGGKALGDELDRERAALADSRAMCERKDAALLAVQTANEGDADCEECDGVDICEHHLELWATAMEATNRALALTPDSVRAQREGEAKAADALRDEHEHAGVCDFCATCEDHAELWNKADDALAALRMEPA